MFKKNYNKLSRLLSWRGAAAVVALGCGILLGFYSPPTSGVLGGLLCLAGYCGFERRGSDRSDELLDILWVKDSTLGSYQAEIEQVQERCDELEKRGEDGRSRVPGRRRGLDAWGSEDEAWEPEGEPEGAPGGGCWPPAGCRLAWRRCSCCRRGSSAG